MEVQEKVLMESVSGVRGIVGAGLTPFSVLRYASAFGELQRSRYKVQTDGVGPLLVIGRDSRVSGLAIEKMLLGMFLCQGYQVQILGIVPTPTVQFLVMKQQDAVGGVIVTASHNPIEWNGLKFVDRDGLFLDSELCEVLFCRARCQEVLEGVYQKVPIGHVFERSDAVHMHVHSILSLPYMDVAAIAKKRFKVCVDSINGAGGLAMKLLLETCGCEATYLNFEPTGIFAHEPEPVAANLSQLCRAVQETRSDFGIAIDPDSDRCVLIDETGRPLGEEYTLGISVDFLLGSRGKRGCVVKNISTSRLIDDLGKRYGCVVHTSPVGEVHVAKRMLKENAIIGGEGNGGVMLPDLHIGRDAPVAAAIVIMQLTLVNTTLSAYKASLPQWEMVKLKVPEASPHFSRAIELIKAEWTRENVKICEIDGIRVDAPRFWVHVRKSNTEPIIRVISEARTKEEAADIGQQFIKYVLS
ncbi:phosphoglucosamine mutase-like [Schistocerca gregaria]|uniref:phosphoglucosamine mutase-like n=1 Tax=Schistocerca gregaria TaxID=7010 RepID=UPI00211F1070|nr:phosphoglucosamine mutase-like [Schistocerca gregaria]